MKEILEKVRPFFYRNARPLDFARFQFHFEHGTQEAVLFALSAYQNEDGGFGHALEPDAWNPTSSPIQTWAATEILREVGLKDPAHPIILGILRYLESGAEFNGRTWNNTIASNNAYPHAPWWHMQDETSLKNHYNPTACLSGFLVKYAEEGSALETLGIRIAKEAAAYYEEKGLLEDMHTVHCFIRLLEYVEESLKKDVLDTGALKERLMEQVDKSLTRDTAIWETEYVCKPSRFIRSTESPFYAAQQPLVEAEVLHIQKTQRADGTWKIPWGWGEASSAWFLSKHWWKSTMALEHLLFLRGLKKL